MPELPEIHGLVTFLSQHTVGKTIAAGYLINFSALKTYDPPLDALVGLEVSAVQRHGKFLDLDAQGVHLVVHLARAGWLTWHEEVPRSIPRPGKSGAVLRVVFDDDSGLTFTEAGTRKDFAMYVVSDPADVPGVAALGVDPLSEEFTPEVLGELLHGAGRAQLKGVLREQRNLAGIGNAYSDEILHAAKLSPYTPSSSLDEAQVEALHGHIRQVLGEAVDSDAGLPPEKLKDNKRAAMRVHGRAGETCDVCGSTIAEVSFADSSLQYCPGCQTGGKPLADRRMSKLLK